MTKAAFTIADIESQVSTSEAVEFEPFLPNGEPSGITLLVLSDQSPKVARAIQELRDQRKRKEQINEAKARAARPGEVIMSAEEDDDYTRKLVAVRVDGWKGLDDPFNFDNACRLLKAVPAFITQILNRSTELSSFTNPSSKS